LFTITFSQDTFSKSKEGNLDEADFVNKSLYVSKEVYTLWANRSNTPDICEIFLIFVLAAVIAVNLSLCPFLSRHNGHKDLKWNSAVVAHISVAMYYILSHHALKWQ